MGASLLVGYLLMRGLGVFGCCGWFWCVCLLVGLVCLVCGGYKVLVLVIALRLGCLRFGLRIHCVLVGWFGGFWGVWLRLTAGLLAY